MSVIHIVAAVVAAVAMVAALPVGFAASTGDANAAAWKRIWPVVGTVGAVSLVAPQGGLAVGAALFYAAACVALALSVPVRLARLRPWPVTEPAVAGALLSPLVGAIALVLDRLPGATDPGLLWWVVAVNAIGCAAGLRAASMVARSHTRANRRAALGAALIAWAPGLAAVLTLVIGSQIAFGAAGFAAVLALVGAVLSFRREPRPQPCSAQHDHDHAHDPAHTSAH